VLGTLGRGVFELAPAGAMGEDLAAPEREVAWMRRLSSQIGRPVSFALLQVNNAPDLWREILRLANDANGEGADLRPQVAGRALNLLIGLQGLHPFRSRPTYAAIAGLPLAARVAELRKPSVRAAILAEAGKDDPLLAMIGGGSTTRMFPLGEPPNYEPTPDMSVAAIAAREGRPEEEVLYDLFLRHDGRELVLFTLGGYSHGSLDDMREMLVHPNAALGLSDGGAHCGVICDASAPTFMLSHWARDRADGLPIEFVVRRMTSDTAHLYGLDDRGVVAPGYKADLNLVDLEHLNLKLPELVFDLPAGARRLIQRAEGWTATICSGEVTLEGGEHTDARPGRLVRGAQAAPGA
jgi:N-acyl-D-aspartate/D-glutamate deacylase